jgi:hypothetical protein
MNHKKCKPARLWKQFEDVLVPKLRLTYTDRAVYSHLIRHTLIEGKARLRITIPWLARGARVTSTPAREALHRLVEKGAVRLVERSRLGHVIEVRRPEQIRFGREAQGALAQFEECGVYRAGRFQVPKDIEEINFLRTRVLRETIYKRDRGVCFYCLRRVKPGTRCLDHVVPRCRSGRNSYRNLVCACMDCNSQKSGKPAGDFLRRLYREGRLTAAELTAGLRALRDLAAGKLRPTLPPVPGRNAQISPRGASA